MKLKGKYYLYQNDMLGTPKKMITIDGSVIWDAKHTSFGMATFDTPHIVVNNLRFPGQFMDHETKLFYNRYRYFDSNSGRYLRTDPIGIMGGKNSLYLYAKNNPNRMIDPVGLSPFINEDGIPRGFGGCSPVRIIRIERALTNVTNAINSKCIQGIKLKSCLKQKFTEINFYCDADNFSALGRRPACAWTWAIRSNNVVAITPAGFFEGAGGCSSLESSILHEMVHICDNNAETIPNGCQESCFGDDRNGGRSCDCRDGFGYF